jgi:hypothetical protein
MEVGDAVWFEFVESEIFATQVSNLGGEVLVRIQSDLVQNPERGAIVKGTHGVRKAEWLIQLHREVRAGGTDTSIFTWNTLEEFIYCICSAKASKLICRLSKSKLSVC